MWFVVMVKFANTLPLTVGWIAVWLANALLAPLGLMLFDMVGGVVSVFISLFLIMVAACVVFVGAESAWEERSVMALFVHALVPAIAMGLSVLTLTKPALELSWQTLNGPRDVPIW